MEERWRHHNLLLPAVGRREETKLDVSREGRCGREVEGSTEGDSVSVDTPGGYLGCREMFWSGVLRDIVAEAQCVLQPAGTVGGLGPGAGLGCPYCTQ